MLSCYGMIKYVSPLQIDLIDIFKAIYLDILMMYSPWTTLIMREKCRDLKQSYDKPLIRWTVHNKSKTKTPQNVRLHKHYGPTKVGQLERQQSV